MDRGRGGRSRGQDVAEAACGSWALNATFNPRQHRHRYRHVFFWSVIYLSKSLLNGETTVEPATNPTTLTMTTVDEEDYYTPLADQRVFGAGIKRKRIDFVPASATASELTTVKPFPPAERPSTVGNHYLSIVLPKSAAAARSDKTEEAQDQALNTTTTTSICPICKQPVTSRSSSPSGRIAVNLHSSHESSIAHQVCLEHSYPPSHLDRERVGVKYLAAYGWDVDSRKGLGAREEGIRIPIKVKEKKDTIGLRETVNDDDDDDDDGNSTRVKKRKKIVKRQEKPVLLDAKQLKRRAIEETKRMERLRQSFYGPDLEQYLGPDG